MLFKTPPAYLKLKTMEFRNKKGELLKTNLPEDIMNQIAEMIELELKRDGVFYFRNGTKFNVKPNDVNKLLDAQMGASKKLFQDGVITLEMIRNDINTNFF